MTTFSPSRVVDLDDPYASDPGRFGTKAAVLARLRCEGLPVPDGVVVPVEFCASLVGGSEHAHAQARSAASAAVRRLGDVRVAVRSSGVEEDLPDASFAGQYETIVGVRGVDEVADAIERCVASGASERVGTYAAMKGTAGGAAVAVLVQRLVEATAAGVAFTANPVTGDREEIIVSAVRGMGERLVSGQAVPDEWTVRGGTIECRVAPEGAVDVRDVASIAELARRVELILGGPQDVEWAIEAGRLWLLQGRPITALPQPPVIDVPEGYWTKDNMHYPAPFTPFGASVYLPAAEAAVSTMIGDFGLPFDGMCQRSLGGEAYTRVVPPGGKDRPAPPWWVVAIATRLLPAMRRRDKAARRALDTNLAGQLLEQWPTRRAEFLSEVTTLRRVELTTLDDGQLVAHLDTAIDLLRRGELVHFQLFMPYVIALYQLGTACEELLGWPPAQSLTLVSGLSDASSETGRALGELASDARSSPDAAAIIRAGHSDAIEQLRTTAPEIARRVDEYLETYGHRPMSYDPGDVTLAERPGLLMGLLRDELDGIPTADQHGPRADRDAALATARARLATTSPAKRERFEHAVAFAARAYPVREDNVLVVDLLPSGLIRRAVLEIGRRLVERGTIPAAEDVVFLVDREARAALADETVDWRDRVRRRKAERAWVLAHPGPATYGHEPSPPPADLRGMPRGLRYVSGALMWIMDQIFPKPSAPSRPGDDELHGIPGSPGRYTGRVRVVREESQFDQLQKGDILVCPTTSPAWALLFTRAGALVTDGGAVLSHAAVIAREYGIPAVLATGDATHRLHSGDLVTVDGVAGTVLVDSRG